jgi:hypothetical protein
VIIDQTLTERIRQVYPTGLLWERTDEHLSSKDQDFRISNALTLMVQMQSVRTSVQPWKKPAYQYAITHIDDPVFDDWVWRMGNAGKLRWIAEHDRPYVVLWLRVSRVADYFYHYFNHWVPRGDTGYLDADFRREPTDAWHKIEETMCVALHSQRFVVASPELLAHRTPLVLDQGWDEIAEDDPRLDDDGFKPPLVECSLFDCLFGD